MKYKFERADDYDDDYGLGEENRDYKRQRRNKRGKRNRDSLEGRDRKWEDWD